MRCLAIITSSIVALCCTGRLVAQVERVVTAEDMPRIPSLEPTEALKSFRLAGGFGVELVAAEPLVSDPVAACFDEFGRMFVAEMHGYPFSHESTKLNPKGGGLKDAGIIRMLEDTDGDGAMDKSVVFADGLNWPTSVCCYNGGVFVIAPGNLHYLKDTDGDGKADVREVVLAGFGRENVQAVTNGLLWGLDNHIYFAAGRNSKHLKLRGEDLFRVGSSDLRFDPKTETFEIVGGGQQFGHSRDDWGTRFVCSNSDHIRQVIYPAGYLDRNPYLVVPGLVQSIASDGASARVFRTSPPEPWRIVRQKWRAADKGYRLVINDDGGWEFLPLDPSKKAGVVPTEYPVGFFTSATGITVYRGNAYPKEYSGNAFVGDVGGNLVHRKVVDTTNVKYTSKRADAGEELLASSDNWFRPVNFVNAPDGSLYILDMYRETIEHPHSIPEEIKAFLDLTSGRDRGRIYRLVSPNMKRKPVVKIGELNNEELVGQLASGNGWNRDTAQRLLWERQDATVVPLVEKLLIESDSAQGRMHCLAVLAGLDALTAQHLLTALQDVHPRVRAHAVKLSESLLAESPDLLDALLPLSHDSSEHVRFQLALTMGQSPSSAATTVLVNMASDAQNSAEVRTAILSSVADTADHVLFGLLRHPEVLKSQHLRSMITDLGLIIGANKSPDQALSLLTDVTAADDSFKLQQLAISALGKGLSRRGVAFEDLLRSDVLGAELWTAIHNVFDRSATGALDDGLKVADRLHAIEFLSFADYEQAIETLPTLLTSRSTQTIQQAAVKSLGQQASDNVAGVLLNGWKTYTPLVRREVVEVLLSKTARVRSLLDAVEAGTVKRGDIDRDQKQLLAKHRDRTIGVRSVKLLGREVTTARSKVVAEYRSALNQEGDVNAGKAVFTKICASCHRVGDIGYKVAPDLASVKNKSEEDLLIAILDPNREAQPSFNTYTVVTQQGRSFSGIIASESANSITLKRAQEKQDVVLRTNIDEMIATGVSLMPEGLEKDLSKQQIADVIAFVKSIER